MKRNKENGNGNENEKSRAAGNQTRYMVQLALLIAVVLLMAFTPLGYLKINPALEITLIVVPVAIGAIILGPKAGAALGLVFGLTSFYQCFGSSPFGVALLQINPVSTAFLCVVPRVLAGWLAGWVFLLCRRGLKLKNISYFAASLACPLFNTVLFMLSLVGLFYHTEYIQGFVKTLGVHNPAAFIILFVGFNGLVEALVCFLVSGAVSRGLAAALRQA